MMKSAEEVIVVADSTKFGHTSLSQLCELDEIDVLVTDHEISEAWRERFAAAGVKLVVASDANPVDANPGDVNPRDEDKRS